MIPKFIQKYRKKRAQRLTAEHYHETHKRRMEKELTLIKENQGKTLTSSLKKKCDEYAVEILKHEAFAPELYVYALILGEFKEGLIPNNYYKSVVIPQLNGKYGQIANLRLLEDVIFPPEYFPTIGSYAKGIFYDKNHHVIPPDDVKDILLKDKNQVIFKLDTSHKGKGIFIFDKHSFDVKKLKKLGTGVFQKFINQHSFFREFTPESVATLRITTTQDGIKEITGRASYLRFSLGADKFIKSDNSIRIPVNIKNGQLSDFGFTSSWKKVYEHPDSQASFENKKIPGFSESLSLVKELHKQIPFIKCIGWDVIVNAQNEVRIMEWNALGNDINSHEAMEGPCFKDLNWESLALDYLVKPYQNVGYY